MAGRNKINFTIKTLIMEIKVTGCHDCPFAEMEDRCSKSGFYIGGNYISQTKPASCPLKQETITIKLKEEKSFNCLYRGENHHHPFC